MPIYEFECKKCGHLTAFLEDRRAKKEHECERCGSKDTEKVFSPFGTGHADSGKSSDLGSNGNGGCLPSCAEGECPADD